MTLYEMFILEHPKLFDRNEILDEVKERLTVKTRELLLCVMYWTANYFDVSTKLNLAIIMKKACQPFGYCS